MFTDTAASVGTNLRFIPFQLMQSSPCWPRENPVITHLAQLLPKPVTRVKHYVDLLMLVLWDPEPSFKRP